MKIRVDLSSCYWRKDGWSGGRTDGQTDSEFIMFYAGLHMRLES